MPGFFFTPTELSSWLCTTHQNWYRHVSHLSWYCIDIATLSRSSTWISMCTVRSTGEPLVHRLSFIYLCISVFIYQCIQTKVLKMVCSPGQCNANGSTNMLWKKVTVWRILRILYDASDVQVITYQRRPSDSSPFVQFSDFTMHKRRSALFTAILDCDQCKSYSYCNHALHSTSHLIRTLIGVA